MDENGDGNPKAPWGNRTVGRGAGASVVVVVAGAVVAPAVVGAAVEDGALDDDGALDGGALDDGAVVVAVVGSEALSPRQAARASAPAPPNAVTRKRRRSMAPTAGVVRSCSSIMGSVLQAWSALGLGLPGR